MWGGRPLILGDVDSKAVNGSGVDPTLRTFFTWRQSWAWDPGKATSGNGSTSTRSGPAGTQTRQPPKRFLCRLPGTRWTHWAVVITAMSNGDTVRSRAVDARYETSTMDQGIQFAQQWTQALKIDPQLIFVTGWNEWIAQRFIADHEGIYAGRPQPKGGSFFVDNYSEEFSRDIMPMTGRIRRRLLHATRRWYPAGSKALSRRRISHLDTSPGNSYRQYILHHGIPSYRTISTMPEMSATATMMALGTKQHYTNDTGRNDIVEAKVACDAKFIYFYVRTHDPLTPPTDPRWMQLLIDADQNHATGWNGYDYLISPGLLGRAAVKSTSTIVKRLQDGKTWRVSFRTRGSEMQVAVPRSILRSNKSPSHHL